LEELVKHGMLTHLKKDFMLWFLKEQQQHLSTEVSPKLVLTLTIAEIQMVEIQYGVTQPMPLWDGIIVILSSLT
jgi:hypothetical protein